MTFDPARLLDLAEKLTAGKAGATDPESNLRTALNRAYYGPFLDLIRRIEEVSGRGTVPKVATHNAIRNALDRSRERHLGRIKHLLQDLEQGRNDADYDLYVAIAQVMVEDNLEKARRLIHTIRCELPDAKVRMMRF